MDDIVYWSLKQIANSEKYHFTSAQLRILFSRRQTNGLESAVKKTSKRLLIRMDIFDQWLKEQKA